MAVAYFSEFREGTSEQAQQVADSINARLGGQPPEGGMYHAEGSMVGGGWWTFNVWESEEAYQRFYSSILAPALEGVEVAEPQSRELSVSWESSQLPVQAELNQLPDAELIKLAEPSTGAVEKAT